MLQIVGDQQPTYRTCMQQIHLDFIVQVVFYLLLE
jgi:hypothetical protein